MKAGLLNLPEPLDLNAKGIMAKAQQVSAATSLSLTSQTNSNTDARCSTHSIRSLELYSGNLHVYSFDIL